MRDYNHSTEEREGGGKSGVQGHPQLRSKFGVSLEFKKSCLKKISYAVILQFIDFQMLSET